VIASGNELIKDAAERDRMGQDFGALCVEIEAAGLMNDFPCIVIRGICDYADSYKNDKWQKYAALAAAAYAKEFLVYLSLEQTSREKPI
jgi:nucleoside phosphorylase